ncbi:SNF2 family N-terminal domain-containing protein [Rhodocollybia butyracea]|uniref:SNF2 family N-terminal domain-containing protein n=1 Tax=Rhodocollybia butyracea TaxID=206335 RepID=A0A9P5PZ35_9AGAR|nr:SNF2 family N-terminal domain-containing protein [Rhodocollybia butyracea]
MSASEPNPLKLAKKHLNLSEQASHALVPVSYLNDLKNHLVIYPDDHNFQLKATPNDGYGKLTCLDCKVDVTLGRNLTLADGGKKVGIGSLSAYRAHIAQHPSHAKNHLARLRGEAGKAPSNSPKRSLIKKETRASILQRERSNSRMISGRPSLKSSIETSSSELTTPRTLVSSGVGSSSPVGSTKKLKMELTPKAPLGTSTNTIAGTSSAAPTTPHHILGGSARSQLETLQNEITEKRSQLNQLLLLPKLNARRLQQCYDDLASLYLLKTEIPEDIALRAQAAAGPSRLPWHKAHSETKALSAVKSEPSEQFVPNVKSEASFAAVMPRIAIKPELSVTRIKPEPSAARIKPEPTIARVPSPLAHLDIKPMAVRTKAFPQLNATAGPSNQPAYHAPVPGYVPNPFLYDDFDEDGDFQMGENEAANAIARKFAGQELPDVAAFAQRDDDRDENGEWHGRGKDHFQGPVANVDDIDKFLVEAGNSENFDHNATVEKALEKLGLASLHTPLSGMEVDLMAHQAIGVAWMVEKEKSSFAGGCLADEMGLGKTVQLIALMTKNQSQDPKCKTTLILAPTALLDQWKLELETKANVANRALIYHGSSKPKKASELLKYDVVLTTFQTMALEWPDLEAEEKKKKQKAKAKRDDFIVSDEDDNLKVKPKKKKELGLLFQVKFFRIVLDEAQNIRNKKTRVSRAVTALEAKHRWCLTGTPIVNTLLDTYGYLRFLKIRPWYDWQEFNGHIGRLEKKNPQLAITRLQTVLNTFLLRRKKDTKLDGKVLIDLPTKEVILQRLEFSEEEREIYDAVEKRMQTQFNRFLRAGTVLKNYHQVLVLLLRLRQICAHPALIQEDGVAFVAADELDDTGRVLKKARDLVSAEFVTKLKTKFRVAALERIQAEKESEDATFEDDDCMCPICFDNLEPHSTLITTCAHSFCKECITNVFNTPFVEPANEPARYAADERPCPACRSNVKQTLLFEQYAFLPTDEDLKEALGEGADSDIEMDEPSAEPSKSEGKGKAPVRKTNRKKKLVVLSDDESDTIDVDAIQSDSETDDDDDMSDFIVDSDEDEEEKDARKTLKKRLGKRQATRIIDSDEESEKEEEKEIVFAIKLLPKFLPSTKMKAMMEYIKNLYEEHPNEKILVISQWTSCLSLVSHYLTENDVLHVKYQGDMNRRKRDDAVRAFMSKKKARVMLMSLKCGGVGLNLTRANHVISLDLGWSPAIEAQAFDRIHRLGQNLAVKVNRLVIENTVEDRILTMQERKQVLADGSLGEGNAKKNPKNDGETAC